MAGNRMRNFLRTGSAAAVGEGQQPSKGVVSSLISLQEWDRLRVLLSTDVGRLAISQEMETSGDFVSESALNFACRFHPPVEIVKAMAALSPEMVLTPDAMGRSPLHIAAKWGADPRVVRYLTESHPASAGSQDVMGKTPLHLAAESYSLKYSARRTSNRPLKESILEVIRTLCKYSPTTVNLEDNDEMTALEYAIESDLDLKVVRSLQKACEKDWKRRRNAKDGTARNHTEVQRSLLVQQEASRLQASAPPPKPKPAQRPTLQQPQPDTSSTRVPGLDSSSRPRRPGLDISSVSAALSSLETEKSTTSSTGAGPVPISHPRKKTSTRALVA